MRCNILRQAAAGCETRAGINRNKLAEALTPVTRHILINLLLGRYDFLLFNPVMDSLCSGVVGVVTFCVALPALGTHITCGVVANGVLDRTEAVGHVFELGDDAPGGFPRFL